MLKNDINFVNSMPVDRNVNATVDKIKEGQGMEGRYNKSYNFMDQSFSCLCKQTAN